MVKTKFNLSKEHFSGETKILSSWSHSDKRFCSVLLSEGYKVQQEVQTSIEVTVGDLGYKNRH